MVLKIKDKDGKLIGTLRDEDTEPTLVKCKKCDGTGWNFKDRSPPFPRCICKTEKEVDNANLQ